MVSACWPVSLLTVTRQDALRMPSGSPDPVPFKKALSRYQDRPFPQILTICPSPPGMSWASSLLKRIRPVSFFAFKFMLRTLGSASEMVPVSAVYDAVNPPYKFAEWLPMVIPGILISLLFIGWTKHLGMMISFSNETAWIFSAV